MYAFGTMFRSCEFIFYFCVKIDEAINCISGLRVETIDGSAVEGEDYEPVNEILTFEPREREKEVCCTFLFFNNLNQYDIMIEN